MLMRRLIFTILTQKRFVWWAFKWENKEAFNHSKRLFLVFARKLAKQNVFVLGWWKINSISTKVSHTHRKISGGCKFHGRCNYKYSTHQGNWDLIWRAPLVSFIPRRLQDDIMMEGNQEEPYTEWVLLRARNCINKEKVKSEYTGSLILCGAYCMFTKNKKNRTHRRRI